MASKEFTSKEWWITLRNSRIPNSIRNKIKKLENIRSKYVKSKWSLVFNDTCLKEKLIPNFARKK